MGEANVDFDIEAVKDTDISFAIFHHPLSWLADFNAAAVAAFEDLSIALAEVEAEKEVHAAKAGIGKSKSAPKRTIGNLPAALPRIAEVIEPASLICPCGCGVMHRIGEDRSERLDIVPAQLRVIVTVRPKYACRTCTDGVTQGEPLCAIGSRTMASAPSHLIMGGLPTKASIAHVLVSKYADHLPLSRQSQILARAGLDLHRAVLADWLSMPSAARAAERRDATIAVIVSADNLITNEVFRKLHTNKSPSKKDFPPPLQAPLCQGSCPLLYFSSISQVGGIGR